MQMTWTMSCSPQLAPQATPESASPSACAAVGCSPCPEVTAVGALPGAASACITDAVAGAASWLPPCPKACMSTAHRRRAPSANSATRNRGGCGRTGREGAVFVIDIPPPPGPVRLKLPHPFYSISFRMIPPRGIQRERGFCVACAKGRSEQLSEVGTHGADPRYAVEIPVAWT